MKPIMKSLLIVLAVVGIVNAQGQPEFEVATVKLSAPVQPGVPYPITLGGVNHGTVTLRNTTLSECIQFAYRISADAQIAGPDWIKSRDLRFDIVGKAPADTPQDTLRVMTQNLLADRLKLAVHHEERQLPFLALVVAKNGPKLLPAKTDAEVPNQLPGRIFHPRMPMQILASALSRFERQTVIDMTGLTGAFFIDLQWTPDALRNRADQGAAAPLVNGPPVDLNGPSLPTALQEQLGLRLESRKGPVDVWVVDHAEKVPADN
jgi:uncharacterized protein (TIGR03435 family)